MSGTLYTLGAVTGTYVLILGVYTGVIVLIAVLVHGLGERPWRRFIRNREPLTDEEFIAACNQPERLDPRVVAAVRKVLGEALESSTDKASLVVYPRDDFWEDLIGRPGSPLWDEDPTELVKDVERELRQFRLPRLNHDNRTGRAEFKTPEQLAMIFSDHIRAYESNRADQNP